MDLRVGAWQGSPPVPMETPLCHLPDATARAGPLAAPVFQTQRGRQLPWMALQGQWWSPGVSS